MSLFGVTDLFELAATTHRFESRYLDALIGRLPADADRYREQSPITHADKIATPVLVLQGDEDRAVPKPQADAMVDAMRHAGAQVDYQVYAGEGHGFRKLENVVDELERTEAFLTPLGAETVSANELKYLTEIELQGPKRGADRAVLLAHGAGADMHAATLTTFADSLAKAGVPAMRFNFPYRSAGKRAPDRAAVLAAATREAAAELARRTKLPPERLVLGGRSMGGRYASLAVGDADDPLPALGLALLGYPLHPAGHPEKLRVRALSPAPGSRALRERDARLARRCRGAPRPRQGDPRPGRLPLDRERRPRLQAAEGERSQHLDRVGAGGRRRDHLGGRATGLSALP